MNCPAKLISKAFFSRIVRSLAFSGRGLVAGLRNRESGVVRSETTFCVGKREVEVDDDKGDTRDRERKTRREWKMKKMDESA